MREGSRDFHSDNVVALLTFTCGYVALKDAYEIIVTHERSGEGVKQGVLRTWIAPYPGPGPVTVRVDAWVDLAGLVDFQKFDTDVLAAGRRAVSSRIIMPTGPVLPRTP